MGKSKKAAGASGGARPGTRSRRTVETSSTARSPKPPRKYKSDNDEAGRSIAQGKHDHPNPPSATDQRTAAAKTRKAAAKTRKLEARQADHRAKMAAKKSKAKAKTAAIKAKAKAKAKAATTRAKARAKAKAKSRKGSGTTQGTLF